MMRCHSARADTVLYVLPSNTSGHGASAFDRLDESVGDEHREVEIREPPLLALGVDEGLDIRVVAGERRHHGAAALTGGLDRLAHGVPDIHERHGAGCVGADAGDERALGAQCREIVPDAAALLHGEGGLPHLFENGGEIVTDRCPTRSN